MLLLYRILSQLAQHLLPVVGLFSKKVRSWRDARARQELMPPPTGKKVIWMHCSSLGEFEQGRPVWEALRVQVPEAYLLLSFFSSSGYDRQKDNPTSDQVVYLPLDTPKHARQWLDLFAPDLILWVKYDFWFHYWMEAHRRQIPILLFAARFRQDQFLAKAWGAPFRDIIVRAHTICVQDEDSLRMLDKWQVSGALVAGDPRIDRVLRIAEGPFEDPWIESFIAGQPVMVCGSVWEEDLELLLPVLKDGPLTGWKWILAPHDLAEGRINHILEACAGAVRYTRDGSSNPADARVLVLDTIGMLNQVYRWAAITYVGGGFGRSVHNLLEPAAYGQPVLFGPYHHKFPEARGLMQAGGGFEVQDSPSLQACLEQLREAALRDEAGKAARQWLLDHQGATRLILDRCQQILHE